MDHFHLIQDDDRQHQDGSPIPSNSTKTVTTTSTSASSAKFLQRPGEIFTIFSRMCSLYLPGQILSSNTTLDKETNPDQGDTHTQPQLGQGGNDDDGDEVCFDNDGDYQQRIEPTP